MPLVKERLLAGEWYERHLLTKLLRYSPWPETFDALLQLAQNTEAEHYLGRQGALYALGAIGNPAAGPVVAAIVSDHATRPDTRLVAMATLGRIGYREAIQDILPFAGSGDPLMRIFANHTLALLGQPADSGFLLSATDDPDYVIRDEAVMALAHVPGDAIGARLRNLAQNDPNRAVRASATLALLQRELPGRSNVERLQVLQQALAAADRNTAVGVLSLMLDECGPEGRAHLETLALQDDKIVDWNVARMKHHFYRPIDNKGSLGFRTARERSGELWEKWIAGLVPGNPESVLRIEAIGIEEGENGWLLMSLMFKTVPGREYMLQGADEPSAREWTDIGGSFVATDRESSVSEILQPGSAPRFYRVRVRQP